MLIQTLRLQRGWSQQQLATLSGLSTRTIQRLERGQPASLETLKCLAAVFEVDHQQLTGGPDMPAPTPTAAEDQLAFAQVRRIRGFYLHALQYVVVIGGLAAVNLISSPGYLWFQWPAFGWGIGLLAHAAGTFNIVPFFGADWEKRQVEKRLGRPL